MSTSINLSVANFPQVTTSQITWINLRVQQFHPKQFYRAVPRPPICCCHAFVFICGRPRVDTHTYAGLKESCLASPPPDVMLQRSFSYFGFKSSLRSKLTEWLTDKTCRVKSAPLPPLLLHLLVPWVVAGDGDGDVAGAGITIFSLQIFKW